MRVVIDRKTEHAATTRGSNTDVTDIICPMYARVDDDMRSPYEHPKFGLTRWVREAGEDRPIILCAIFVSVGQILMFAALAHASVSTVVIIASMEIFITIFLSWLVLGTEKAPGAVVLSSAALAVLGVVLVAGG